MHLNIGSPERVARIVIGLALQPAGAGRHRRGAILTVTGLVSWCPIWAALGVDTRKTNA